MNAEKERWRQDQKAALDVNVSQAARERTGGAKAGVIARECNSTVCTNSPDYGVPGSSTPEFCSDHKKEGMVDLNNKAKKGKGKAKTQVTKEVVEEAVVEKAAGAVGAAGQAKAAVEMEVEEDFEEDPGTAKKDPRKPRKPLPPKRSSHSDLFEKLGSRELFLTAALSKAVQKRPKTGKEDRYISPRMCYKILGSALTDDSTKSLLYGKVFFDPRVFEDTGASSASSWHYKFLPYNAGELGVEIGTKVRVDNAEGAVTSVKHNDVVIQVEGRQEQRETVLFVLQHAVENQGVTSLEQAQRKFILDLSQIIVLIHIVAPIAINLDTDRTHKDNMYHDFPKEIARLEATLAKKSDDKQAEKLASLKEYSGDVEKSNSMLWSVLYNIPARDTIRVVPKSFSPGLVKFIAERGSLVEMLGFQHLKDSKGKVIGPDLPETGIFGNNKAVRCTGTAAGFTNDLAKYFQEASMLGRFLNYQSITAPLTVSKLPTSEFDILLGNAKSGKEELMVEKNNLYGWTDKTATTRATEAIVCLGSFIPSIPLGAIRMITREKGKLKDVSTGGYFAHMQKVETARRQSMPDGDPKDSKFFAKVSEYLHPTSIEKRAAAEREKERNGLGGYTSKVLRGEVHADVRKTHGLMNEAVDTVYNGFISGFVKKFKTAEITLGREILKGGQVQVGARKNEDHIYTEKVRAIAQRLIDEEGVTCDYASEVTKFVFLLDRFINVPIRRGNHEAMRARDTFFDPDGVLKDFIWNRIKDDHGKQKLSVIHWKHEKITDAYVLMVVFLRAVFRLHGHQLDDEIFPLDSYGHKMDQHNRGQFIKTAGQWFLGLPEFHEHILRNILMTVAIDKLSEEGEVPDHSRVIRQLCKDCHTTMKMTMKHYDESRNASVGKGICLYNIDSLTSEKQQGVARAVKQAVGQEMKEIKNMLKSSSSSSVGTISLNNDVDSGKGSGKGGALVSTREAEMEKAFAAKEFAAKEKALERAEALAAKKFAAEEKAFERQEALAAMEFAAKEKALISKVSGGGGSSCPSGSQAFSPQGLPHEYAVSNLAY